MFASDWKSSATVRMNSGGPLTVVTGVDDALNGINASTQYASQVSADTYGNKSSDNLTGTNSTSFWLNRAAFARPAPGTYGNMGPGTLHGPGSLNFDAGLSRLFQIKERQRVELRAEAQNVLNRTNFLDPSTSLSANTFGRIQSARDPRIMQFALKYSF